MEEKEEKKDDKVIETDAGFFEMLREIEREARKDGFS